MKEVYTEERSSRKTMGNSDMVELGKNIQKQREFLGMSQESLGLDIGTNTATICLYETAQRTMKVDRLFEIADTLMVTPTELCPERFNTQERIDPRLFQIGEKMKKLSPEKQAAAYQAMEAMMLGFMSID